LARHENDFEAAAEATVDVDELLGALRRTAGAKAGGRSRAIANCLSGGDGWRDAAAELGGAFAALGEAAGLTSGKDK
jgi:hypothetical protein